MSEHGRAVKAAYETFDVRAELLDPNVEWQTNWPGLAPAVHGIEGVRSWAEAFMEPWERMAFTVYEIVEVDAQTVFVSAHLVGRGKESGVEVEMDVHDVLTFRDGRIVLRRTWPERGPARAAAGLAP